MDLVWTLLGVALIAIALRDIFNVLFHPLGRGMVARWVIRSVGWIARHLPSGEGTIGLLVGPLGYIAVVATWAALLALGWAFIFLPQLPQGFNFDLALDPSRHSGFLDALYVSMVNLTSLGYGDISPGLLAAADPRAGGDDVRARAADRQHLLADFDLQRDLPPRFAGP